MLINAFFFFFFFFAFFFFFGGGGGGCVLSRSCYLNSSLYTYICSDQQ